MTIDKYNIDKLFSENLKTFEEEPPVHVWGNVKEELSGVKHKRRVVLIWAVAASIGLIIAFGTGYFVANYNTVEQFISKDESTDQGKIINDNNIRKNLSEFNRSKTDLRQATEEDIIPENESVSGRPELNAPQTHTSISNAEKVIFKNNSRKANDTPGKLTILQTLIPDKKSLLANINPSNSLNAGSSKDIANSKDIKDKGNVEELTPPKLKSEQKKLNEQLAYVDTKKKAKWTLGGQGAPTYSYRHINQIGSSSQLYAGSTLPVNQSDYSEEALMAYAGGVDIGYSVSKRISIHSGVTYSKIGQVKKNIAFTSDRASFGVGGTDIVDLETAFGNISTSKDNFHFIDSVPDGGGITTNSVSYVVNDSKIIQNFQYLEIPLLISYKVIDKQIDFNVKGGISPGILIGNKAYVNNELGEQELGKTDDVKSMIYNTVIGFGIGYDITKKIQIKFEPQFKYSINSITEGIEVENHPYSISFFTGLEFAF